MWERWKKRASSGEVIITDNQTNGRGQRSNQWFSHPGKGITCSFLLCNNLKKKIIGMYSILIAIGICKGIQNLLSLAITQEGDLIENLEESGYRSSGIYIIKSKSGKLYVDNLDSDYDDYWYFDKRDSTFF